MTYATENLHPFDPIEFFTPLFGQSFAKCVTPPHTLQQPPYEHDEFNKLICANKQASELYKYS